MNITDLRAELTSHADGLGTARDQRAGVAVKVRATKRRRAAAAGSAATLAIAALAVGLLTTVDRSAPNVPAGPASSDAPMVGPDGMPYRSVPDGPGDVVKDGLRYRTKVGDDALAVGFIGDKGQTRFSLVWEPTTTHVSLGADCYLPSLTETEARNYMISVGPEGGTGVFGSQCSAGRPADRDLTAGGDVPGEPGRGWTELTVGHAARVRVQLVAVKTRQPAAVNGALLTAAVYEQGPQQPVQDAAGRTVAVIPQTLEHQGYRYELMGCTSAPLSSWQDVTQGLPPGPALVTWGSAGGSAGADPSVDGVGLRLTGLRSGAEERAYGSWGTTVVPVNSTPRFTVSAVGRRPDLAVGFVAVYRLER